MTRKPGLGSHHSGGNWMEQSPVEPRAEHSGYFPNTEQLGEDEMRVIILGSGMPNARKNQASASVLVELGNGDKFIFDIGSEQVANLGALEIPYDQLDEVFISYLHQDHFADLPALWIGGWESHRCCQDPDRRGGGRGAGKRNQAADLPTLRGRIFKEARL